MATNPSVSVTPTVPAACTFSNDAGTIVNQSGKFIGAFPSVMGTFYYCSYVDSAGVEHTVAIKDPTKISCT